jgi:hypothetical protein
LFFPWERISFKKGEKKMGENMLSRGGKRENLTFSSPGGSDGGNTFDT